MQSLLGLSSLCFQGVHEAQWTMHSLITTATRVHDEINHVNTKDYHLTKTVANSRLSLHYLILIALQISKNFLPFLASFSMLPLSVPLVLYSGWVCVWSPWWWLWMWELPLWNPPHGLRVVAILKLKYKFHRSIYPIIFPLHHVRTKTEKVLARLSNIGFDLLQRKSDLV